MKLPTLLQADIVIVGAGIIGLATALELSYRGAQVAVLERDTALSQASTAAAGMLAVHDPYNPPALKEFSEFSAAVYLEFLQRVEELSGLAVPYQTAVTNQYFADGSQVQLQEYSIDPRQLAPAVRAAVEARSVCIQEHTSVTDLPPHAQVIHTTGAWAASYGVSPRKGQMLRVQLPAGSLLNEVHRAEHVYVVPRTQGPQAGTALIGATVENAGFDVTTQHRDLEKLRASASNLNPDLSFLAQATTVEAWAGLRPSTPDGLPVIGRLNAQELIATGHFRNGILLAPGTAKVMADLIENRAPQIAVGAFRPDRFPS